MSTTVKEISDGLFLQTTDVKDDLRTITALRYVLDVEKEQTRAIHD